MKRSMDRILTTHVGSLVRPPEILAVMAATEEGQPYDEKAFAATLRKAVGDVVQTQAEVGIDVPSDGEYGKRGWFHYVSERFDGLERQEEPPPGRGAGRMGGSERARFPEFYEMYERIERRLWLPEDTPAAMLTAIDQRPTFACTAPIHYKGHAALQRDIENFKASLAGVQVEEAFMPVVAPCTLESIHPNRYYPSDEAYLSAAADALNEEYRGIVDAGFLLQIDDAVLTTQYVRMADRQTLVDFRKWAELRIEATNRALSGIPQEKVRYHICWGSQNVPHTADVPLREIVDLVLRVNAAGHSIEAANPRHEHEWQVWRDVKLPAGKVLIPGFISHATNIVEHPELVAWRIANFARVVGRENVIASTDCGFAQNWAVRRVHPSIQWAKLEALVEGARLASKQLWN